MDQLQKAKNVLFYRLSDRNTAIEYIKVAILENNPLFLKSALGDVLRANKLTRVVEISDMVTAAMNRVFAESSDPVIKDFYSSMDFIGLQLNIELNEKIL